MQISARSDYALRALLCLAANHPDPASAPVIAAEQGIPQRFLQTILADLRRAGLVHARSTTGGYVLSLAAGDITIGAVVRAMDGPLFEVRGLPPEKSTYAGVARHLPQLWQAVQRGLSDVLDSTTLLDVLSGHASALVQAPTAMTAPANGTSTAR